MSKVITKTIAAIQPGTDDAESPNGTFDIILSSQSLDRDGDVFKSSEWKMPLPEWIPIDIDHAMTVEKTVGSGKPFLNDNGDVQVRGSYASTPLAQQTRTLVNEGHCRYVSVAVMTDKSLKDGTPNRELLNGAFVNTPSNRDAVVVASKSFDDSEVKAAEGDGDGPKPPYGEDADYADPGYLDREGKPAKDGNGLPRYPTDTAKRTRAAWSFISQESNASQYTAEQLKKIKDKIKAAARKFGIEIAEDDDDKKDDSKSAYGSITDLLAAAVTVKAGARNSAADSKMVQAIHDASSLLGAQCVSEPEPDVADGSAEGANKSVKAMFVIGKSMTGSVEDLRDRIQCALNDASGVGDYGGRWACILATYMNADGQGGSVVYSLGGETLCRAFSDDGACVALDSNIQAVTLVTSVAAIPDTVDGDPTPLPPAAAEAGKSFDRGEELPAPTLKTNTGAAAPVLGVADIEDFKAKLDALTKTSGHEPGSPESPAESPADPPASPDSKAASTQDPADDESADTDDDAADDAADDEAEKKRDDNKKRAQRMRLQLLTSNARLTAIA